MLTAICYLRDGSKPTLFAPHNGAPYRKMINEGLKTEALELLDKHWASVCKAVSVLTSGKKAKRPRMQPCDDLELIYGDDFKEPPLRKKGLPSPSPLCPATTLGVGDVQFEDPMHIHRAPKPPMDKPQKKRRDKTSEDRYRRVACPPPFQLTLVVFGGR